MVNKNEQFLTGQSFQLAPTDYETDESEGVDESLPIGEQIQTLIAQKQDPQDMTRAERRRFEYNNKKREREKALKITVITETTEDRNLTLFTKKSLKKGTTLGE